MDEELKRGKSFLFALSIFKVLDYKKLLSLVSLPIILISITCPEQEKDVKTLVLHSGMKC